MQRRADDCLDARANDGGIESGTAAAARDP